MYMVFVIDHTHYLINESKLMIFTCNNDRRVYVIRIHLRM